jgi:drug/metabolite transporter (DMT)-like permease
MREDSMTRRSWLLFAAMCVIWGIPYLLIRVAVRDIAPGTLVFLRTGIGGLILLPFALHAGGFRPVVRRWAPLVLFSVLEMAIPWLLLSQAEQRLSSSLSGLLIAAVPLLGVVVAWVSKADERTDRWQLLGLFVGLVGVAVLVGVDFGSIDSIALVEMLGVVIGYAIAPAILARKLADLPSLPVVCASLLLVALGYLPYAATRMPTHVAAPGWWSVATLALVCTALAFLLFFALIAGIGPTRATVITYVNPAVALLCGVVFLDESLTLGMAIGFPLILIGSVVGARRRGNQALAEPELVQSMRTGPDDVSNTAATTPVP